MTPDNWQGIAAVILAILTGTAGIIASRRAEHKEEKKGPIPTVTTKPIPVVNPGLTAALDSDGLTEYLKTVLGDNNDLRERLVRLETTVDVMKTTDATFRFALGRWLSKVYAQWGRQDAMPMPEGDDLFTLREVLPK